MREPMEHFGMNSDSFRRNNPVDDLLRFAAAFNTSMSRLDGFFRDYEREIDSLKKEIKDVSNRVFNAERNAGVALAEHYREISKRDRVAKRSICEFNMCFEKRRCACGCDSCDMDGDDYYDDVERQYKDMLEGGGR